MGILRCHGYSAPWNKSTDSGSCPIGSSVNETGLHVLREGPLDKIRVLIANHPVMMPEVVRRLVDEQDDMAVVGDCRGPMKILQEVGRAKADAVILTQEGPDEPGLCSQLLTVYPDLTIISMAPSMDKAYSQQLRSYRKELTNVHIRDIAETVRTAVHDGRGKTTE